MLNNFVSCVNVRWNGFCVNLVTGFQHASLNELIQSKSKLTFYRTNWGENWSVSFVPVGLRLFETHKSHVSSCTSEPLWGLSLSLPQGRLWLIHPLDFCFLKWQCSLYLFVAHQPHSGLQVWTFCCLKCSQLRQNRIE